MAGYLLSDDLIFTSRVVGTANALGLEMRSAKSPDQLANLVATEPPECLLVDLHSPGLAIGELLSRMAEPRPFVVGYGSHVEAAVLKAARTAGCDLVLTRSQFVEELPKSLPAWFGARTTLQ